MNKTSVVDVPKRPTEDDLFGIERYSRGLVRFIQQSDTPITVAIQGEWGSGKTSLMNTIQNELCGPCESVVDIKNHNKEFYSVWINTWQYSLLQSHEQTLMSIVLAVTSQVAKIVSERHQTQTSKVFKSFYQIATRISKGLTTSAIEQVAGSKMADTVDDMLNSEESTKSVKDLRDSLQEIINECIEKDSSKNISKKGFLIFVDDLDRIDPPVAVQILELLKNIFDLSNCIFVLAIDYDVVVKGLKPKFGELTDKNEREFRSFFDKIIQMPFSMPVATYSIDKFLVSNLASIGFLPKSKSDNSELTKNITKICNLSIGTNPRSLKRLLNTVSLINIISNETLDHESNKESEEDHLLLLNFALICIQIAYPVIYKALTIENNFKNWDHTMATNLNLEDLKEFEIQKLKVTEEFNEEWELVLFRICKRDTYLSNKAVQISQLLNLISKVLPEGEDLGSTINELLTLSSVTDIQAYDKPRQSINKGPILKTLSRLLIPELKKKIRPPYVDINQKSKRVSSNVYISYATPTIKNWVGITVLQKKENNFLQIWYTPWAFKVQTSSMIQDLKNAGFEKELDALISSYNKLALKHQDIKLLNPPMTKSGQEQGWHVPHIYVESAFPGIDQIEDRNFLEKSSEIITDFMDCNLELNELMELYKKNTK